MDLYPDRTVTVLVANFGEKHIWLQNNMPICIGFEPPDRIVHLTGDPDGPTAKLNDEGKGILRINQRS